jgi:hypothetical protein
LQYNSLWIDAANNTYFAFWDVSFHPVDPSEAFSRFDLQAVYAAPLLTIFASSGGISTSLHPPLQPSP